MDNTFRMLNLIFKEAQHLNRVPAIGEFTMSPIHNLGDRRADLRFEDYLDLSNGITFQLKQGCHELTASHLDWIEEQKLDLASYAFDKVYNLAADEIVGEKMNQRYDVLMRRDPTFEYVSASKKYKYGKCLIDFPYSRKVNNFVDEVLDALGVSRQDAMAAQHYFLNKVNSSGWDQRYDRIPLNKSYYACMHVRMSDRAFQWPVFELSSSKKNIKSILEHSIARGSQLYIMSDIHQPDFFDFLKSDYRVYRYHDFPNLKRLVSGEDGGKIDNVMLYLVEKNIMKHAAVKILPPHKGPMIYHLNTVYDLTLLKKLPIRLTIRTLRRMVQDLIFLQQPLSKKLQLNKFQKLMVSYMKKLKPKQLLSRVFIR